MNEKTEAVQKGLVWSCRALFHSLESDLAKLPGVKVLWTGLEERRSLDDDGRRTVTLDCRIVVETAGE